MSIALVAPLAPAALEPRPAPVLAQLERLHTDLERPDADIDALLDVHDRAVVLSAFCAEANVAYEVAVQATEAKLRCERRVGRELDRVIAASPAWASHAHDTRMRVPRGLLKQLGVSGSQSSRWRYIARLSDQDFEDQLRAARASKREVTTTSLVRIARRLTDAPKHGGRPRLSTRVLLRRIVTYMAQIKRVETAQERALLQSVLGIAASWQASVARPDIVSRRAACVLCARDRPAFGAPSRCSCGGAWVAS